jgi:bifunctional DNA-binding transcriptional regulator/antitoxin component of YhaV-PrlF toxin-antitoxin module
MQEIPAAISSKGQITLPVAVQRLLGVGPKGRVVFAIDDDQVRLVPARYTLDSVLGSVAPVAPNDDIEEQIRAVKEERAERLVAELDQR